MTTAPPAAGTGASDPAPSTWTWLLPALAFLAGAALSALLFVVGDDDDGSPLAGAEPSPGAASPTASPLPEGELVLQVPAACVEAAELAETVTAALGDVVGAAGSLDARSLQEALDVVQQIRPDVQQASEECRDIAAQGTIVVPSATPSATPSPSGTATPSATASAAG